MTDHKWQDDVPDVVLCRHCLYYTIPLDGRDADEGRCERSVLPYGLKKDAGVGWPSVLPNSGCSEWSVSEHSLRRGTQETSDE